MLLVPFKRPLTSWTRQAAVTWLHLNIQCVQYGCDSDVFWLLSTATSLNTEVNALCMNYKWAWQSCPSFLWISKEALPASLGGNIVFVCKSDSVSRCVGVCVCAPEEALRQIKMDKIIIGRVVVTFLPLYGGRGRVGAEKEWWWWGASCYIITTCDPAPPKNAHIGYYCNTILPSLPECFEWLTKWCTLVKRAVGLWWMTHADHKKADIVF